MAVVQALEPANHCACMEGCGLQLALAITAMLQNECSNAHIPCTCEHTGLAGPNIRAAHAFPRKDETRVEPPSYFCYHSNVHAAA